MAFGDLLLAIPLMGASQPMRLAKGPTLRTGQIMRIAIKGAGTMGCFLGGVLACVGEARSRGPGLRHHHPPFAKGVRGVMAYPAVDFSLHSLSIWGPQLT